MKRKTRRRIDMWWLAVAACIVLCLPSGGMLARELMLAAKERDANRLLSQRVSDLRTEAGSLATAEMYAPSGNLLIYDSLWQENHDMAGWLSIEGLEIDLPVMYTPFEQDYYLHRGFDGSDARSGSLFLAEGWNPEANHAIIYGHNMKDGSMFGKLDQYQALEFAQEHPVIRFDTLTQRREYTVIAAFYSQVFDPSQTAGFHYDQYVNLSEKERFEDYLEQVGRVALYRTGEDVQFGDWLLTLSTCSYHKDNGRFVVVARQK